MSVGGLTSTLSARAARVLAELCAADEPVTVVVVGSAIPIHGRVSFAHGGRAAVVTRSSLSGVERGSGKVVLTALCRDRAVSLQGKIRELSDRSLSLELSGDLRGSDPRRYDREPVTADVDVSLTTTDGHVVGRLRDVSERGMALVVDAEGPCPTVGAAVDVAAGPDVGPLEARVCHCTLGVDGPGSVRVGLGFPVGTDARVLSRLAGG